jgi:hypothetical protein
VLELVRLHEARRQLAVVVDLAVDGEQLSAVGGSERLRAVLDVDDGEPLVGEHRPLGGGHSHKDRAQPQSAALCTPATARPDGSAAFAKLASQAIAAGDEQAIDLPPGTVSAQAVPGKACSNRLR